MENHCDVMIFSHRRPHNMYQYIEKIYIVYKSVCRYLPTYLSYVYCVALPWFKFGHLWSTPSHPLIFYSYYFIMLFLFSISTILLSYFSDMTSKIVPPGSERLNQPKGKYLKLNFLCEINLLRHNNAAIILNFQVCNSTK
jgi:hypothetical protein